MAEQQVAQHTTLCHSYINVQGNKRGIKIKSQNTTVLFSLIRSQNIVMSQPKRINTATQTDFPCCQYRPAG